jgi:hypothetical protein
MANTYIQIGSTVTVGSGGASSIDFASIPSTYTDLVLKVSARSARTGYPVDDIQLQFNGSTTSFTARTLRVLADNSVTSSSETNIGGFISDADQTASTFASTEFYIPNYTASAAYKSVSLESVSENNASANTNKNMSAGLWSNNSAITSIKLILSVSTFVQYSTASLYGIKSS